MTDVGIDEWTYLDNFFKRYNKVIPNVSLFPGGIPSVGGPPQPLPGPLSRVSDSYEAQKPHIRRWIGGLLVLVTGLRRSAH